MRALVQRCLRASVEVDGSIVGEIGPGLLVLVGVTHTDDGAVAAILARKVHELRILRGESSLLEATAPEALVVSQFTLYADTKRGRRPSWGAAAPGATAEPLVSLFVAELARRGVEVATGRFGADMRVESVNDGPITVMLEI